jgi:hypothetical protein
MLSLEKKSVSSSSRFHRVSSAKARFRTTSVSFLVPNIVSPQLITFTLSLSLPQFFSEHHRAVIMKWMKYSSTDWKHIHSQTSFQTNDQIRSKLGDRGETELLSLELLL